MTDRKEFTFEDAVTCAQLFNRTLTDVDLSKSSCICHCPHSNHAKSKKIKIDFAKGWFKCKKCEAGGPSPVSLFMHVTDITDAKEAAHTMHKLLGDDKNVPRPAPVPKKPEPVGYDAADISVRDHTYREMLQLLALSSAHIEALKKRGLSDEHIDALGYKSLPRDRKQLCKKLLQKGCILEGVPGFFKDKQGNWTLNVFGTGIFVPFRNCKEQIQFMQIRTDNPKEDGQRYFALSSSGKEQGTGAKTWVHARKGSEDWKEVCITEGALKADVASALSGKSFLAVAGVNNLGDLPRVLRDLTLSGLEKVHLCYDMDKVDNERVLEGEAKIKEMLEILRVPYDVVEWSGEKGIDDWLYANKK